MSSEKIVKGVNVDDLFKTMVAVKGNPEIAKFNFRAKNRWINGGNNRTGLDAFRKLKYHRTLQLCKFKSLTENLTRSRSQGQ